LNNLSLEKLFTAHIEQDPAPGFYIGTIPASPGAHTHAKTLDELTIRLIEVLQLCFETMTDDEIKNLPQYAGTQQKLIAV
jgi:predicted RNase H-like HicB family nuclease